MAKEENILFCQQTHKKLKMYLKYGEIQHQCLVM